MIRRIIEIDEERCTGCGLCAKACHEGAIAMVNGKAKLAREHFCDGLGDCLPACPADAIRFVEREAPAYDEAAVQAAKASKVPAGGCPGARAMHLAPSAAPAQDGAASALQNWPVQIRLLSTSAPYLQGADLVIAADCTAFSCAQFHSRYLAGRIAMIGCPKLDAVDYSEKLTELFRRNDIRSVLVVRMQVPGCGGLTHAVETALAASGRDIPLRVVILTPSGEEVA